jgi:hypothetical protein
MKRLFAGAVVIALTVMVIRSMPDIRRYQKIRSM